MRFLVLKWHFLSSLLQLLFSGFPYTKKLKAKTLCTPLLLSLVHSQCSLMHGCSPGGFSLHMTWRVCASGAEQLWPACYPGASSQDQALHTWRTKATPKSTSCNKRSWKWSVVPTCRRCIFLHLW